MLGNEHFDQPWVRVGLVRLFMRNFQGHERWVSGVCPLDTKGHWSWRLEPWNCPRMRGMFGPHSKWKHRTQPRPGGLPSHFLHFSENRNLFTKRNVKLNKGRHKCFHVCKVTWLICAILPKTSLYLGGLPTRSSRSWRFVITLKPSTPWFYVIVRGSHDDGSIFGSSTFTDPDSVILIYVPRKMVIKWAFPRTLGVPNKLLYT